jgi:HD-like signal output (HDOD) protein
LPENTLMPTQEPSLPAAQPTNADASRPTGNEEEEARRAALLQAQAEAEAQARQAAVERLLARLSENPDFPSLRDSVRSIQKLARSENAHLRVMTDEIMRDIPLSNKLLRLINAAFYRAVGGGSIDSISRAISLMGFQSVGLLAASLKLFENLPKGPGATRVQQEFSRALMSGLLANQLCPSFKVGESTYLTAVFQNLGRMMVWSHFPAEAQRIETLARQASAPSPEATPTSPHRLFLQQENEAARQVLFISYDDLGVEVARMWGWPEHLQVALRPQVPEDPEEKVPSNQMVRVVCSLSNELAGMMADTPADDREQVFGQFQQTWQQFYGEDPEAFKQMIEGVDAQWCQMSQVMNLAKLQPTLEKAVGQIQSAMKRGEAPPMAYMLSSVMQRPQTGSAPIPPAKTPPAAGAARPLPAGQPPARPGPAATAPTGSRAVPARGVPNAVQAGERLARGMEELSELALGDASLESVLMCALDALVQALGAQRGVACLRERGAGLLRGHLGRGEGALDATGHFSIPVSPPKDLFGLLCAKGADTLISDAHEPNIASRMPQWHTRHIQARSFLILPLNVGVINAGMLYADRPEAHSLEIDEATLKRLKALRNQVLMAMQMRGAGMWA